MKPYKELTIHQKINIKLAEMLTFYAATGNKGLGNILPRSLKGQSRYNTSYDYVAPRPTNKALNEQLSKASDTVKSLIKNNLDDNYLRIRVEPTSFGVRLAYSVVSDRPKGYRDMERTGMVVFMSDREVENIE